MAEDSGNFGNLVLTNTLMDIPKLSNLLNTTIVLMLLDNYLSSNRNRLDKWYQCHPSKCQST